MMVANVSTIINDVSLTYGDTASFAKLQNGNFLLSQPFFKVLHDSCLHISEFRFYCRKPSVGRTIHIATTKSVDSTEFVRYLIGEIDYWRNR